MFVNWKPFLTSVLLFFPIAFASAATNPESAISSDAGIVIRLKQPKLTQQNITGLLNQVDETLSGVLSGSLRTFLGRSISNPALAGVDTSRDLYVGVYLSQANQPGLLYVIPVSDQKAVQEALGEGYHSAVHEKWIVYSEDQKLVDQAGTLLKSREKNFSSQMTASSRDLFADGDLSVYVNSKKLVQVYQPQLVLAGQKIDQTLNQLSATVNTAPGVNVKPMMAMYSAVAKGALQAVQDSQSYTTAVKVTPAGLGVESLFEVKANSVTDLLFQANQPQGFAQLGKFPANQLTYFAGAGNTDALITWGMNFTAQMFDETEQNAEAKAQFESIVKEIRSLKFGSYYFSFELGKLSEGVLNAYTISEVSPSEEMRKYTRQMMSLMKNISLPGMQQQVTMTPDAEKIGDVTVDLTVIKQEINPESDPLQIQKRMLEVLYGPSGITNRMAYPEGKVLQAMGATASMKKFLEALDAPDNSKQLAQNQPAFEAAREEGLSKANLLALIDVPTTVLKIYNILAESQQKEGPFSAGLIKKQGISTSYLTFSLSTGKQTLTTKTYIPVQNMKSGFKVFTILSTQKK
ncbi:hypothetical protein Pan241w_33860 [Gimesia alba]|uniref:DUF3352 domain-containing protein n=1 Tax=Gimesia alba TaxID=2527973 RepID=A0A517RHD0_9PLAN|nr:hypothetical protein [Gimesia alba]QDT43286.1 hypothetical protein Pan241w_33860 [Gimesia alba]